MDPTIRKAIFAYEEQLLQIETAISTITDADEKDKLISLKSDIQQLLDLTRESYDLKSTNHNDEVSSSNSSNSNSLDNEYEQFIAEMKKEGAIERKPINNSLTEDIKALEGTKCKAPHKHNWGEVIYHNAMICSIMEPTEDGDIEVKVMFINPTHREMLPCPYLLDTDCKFSEEQCRFSHGEVVLFSTLKEYIEPNFEFIQVGSKVLAKNSDKLWYRASIKRLMNQKCIVKFESNTKDMELDLHDVLPLEDEVEDNNSDIGSEDENNYEDVINMSLLITPASQALGDWEKFTKGIGSKLMAKMGYITGTGLGRRCDGILEPVSAVVLPAGKSLDHCMKLRENSGGDKDLFSAEKRLKRLQKKQEIRSKKAYEREKNKVDVFNFLNDTLSPKDQSQSSSLDKSKHRQEIKGETSRNLNVACLKIEEDIKKVERDLFKINDSLKRHSDKNSQMYKKLIAHLNIKQNELKILTEQASNIRNEQNVRSDKKKLTIF